jgi:protein-tyrosine kinase
MDSNGRSIGDIIRQTNSLTSDQVKKILDYQSTHGVLFGEAAVALGLVKESEVLWALSQQFQYPYAATDRDKLSTELVVARNPFCQAAEEFRVIRANIITNALNGSRLGKPMFAVLSPQQGEGRSFFVANLAIAFSQLGGRTLIVDADLRNPRQHLIFETNSEAGGGLSSVLSGRGEIKIFRPVDALTSLYLLPSGVRPPNPLELLHRPAFEMLMQELATKFDHIIIDTPSSEGYADARVIAAKCGAALVIGQRNSTRVNALNTLVDELKRVGTHITGVAINR